MKLVQQYDPDFVIIQHEFGIFPKAPYLLQMLQMLETIPYAVVLHSTYEHLDKSICTSAMKNIIVHTEIAKNVLRSLGNSSNISVIPHGCTEFPDRQELWNIFQTPYAIVQFGFGFFYKGVDRAIDAIHILKSEQPEKYKDIFYCYLCSENSHTRNIHSEYMTYLTDKVEKLGLEDNVVIVRKWNTDQEINVYLRTAKLAIFPYLINPDNTVYGASGAIRISFANGIPCIASESHLFDEISGLPRPTNSVDLAREMDKVFSDGKYREALIKNQDDYVANNTWDITIDRYLDVMNQIRLQTAVYVD
jgi:glycosyltransferase involved in cell wall biosynthesis